MFVERKVHHSALFTYLVGWHTGAVSFPPSDVILAQLAWPLSDIIFYLHSGITNLSLYKHCMNLKQFNLTLGCYSSYKTLKKWFFQNFFCKITFIESWWFTDYYLRKNYPKYFLYMSNKNSLQIFILLFQELLKEYLKLNFVNRHQGRMECIHNV